MPQPDLIRHLNARLRARPGSEGDDHFELAGVREVQAHFRGRIFRSVFQPQIRRGGEVICHEAFLQVLARDGNLWFSLGMYVYYTPTHFKEQPNDR